MRISGFSFARNAVKFYFPIKEAILSILPIVDEFVLCLVEGDADDTTREVVESIGDSRIRIVEGVWDEKMGARGYSRLTNVALDECGGDWCFYVQADEVVHEDDLPVIKARCEQLLEDPRVEGLIFDYLHFWGDYQHYQTSHGWYQKEIRVIRNGLGIRSLRTAQSFRHPDERRLTVARSGARIFHYGWVRPPRLMLAKQVESSLHREGREAAAAQYGGMNALDFGPLGRLPVYTGMHPAVMQARIAAMDWQDDLRMVDGPDTVRGEIHKDERFKYRFLSAIERWTGLDLNHKHFGRVLRV
ncbi:MAG: hypothetical protein JSW46_11270 [Gemmatimonadota bacterium]|nr:MAG: hypothetical protein JSW46_11270 [Gemmatimonadota bacterium]